MNIKTINSPSQIIGLAISSKNSKSKKNKSNVMPSIIKIDPYSAKKSNLNMVSSTI